jgi:hypothetical protein
MIHKYLEKILKNKKRTKIKKRKKKSEKLKEKMFFELRRIKDILLKEKF